MNTLTITNNPIGFFDSGVGGLTVYSKFRKHLPNENCLYYGDTEHLPYGNKTKDELISYARFIMDFFAEQNVKGVVIACNTSSSAAYEAIKNDYDFKIYPIIQCCAQIISRLPIKRLGIFATPATIKSGVYESEIKKYNSEMQIYPQSCHNWVNIVESKGQNHKENVEIVKQDLEAMLNNKPEKIILGCTHYPYLLPVLTKFADKSIFIDPSEYFVNYIIEDLSKNKLLNSSTVVGYEKIFVSATPEQFKIASEMFYKIDKLPKLINKETITYTK